MRSSSNIAARVVVATALLAVASTSAQDRSGIDPGTKLPNGGTASEALASPQALDVVEQELIDLHDRWARARIDGDAAFLEQLYATEFRISNMNGHVVERDEDIGLFAARPRVLKPDSIVDEDMRVSVFGEGAALVTGVENLKGSYRGEYAEMALRFTNVLVRRDGRWQMVTHHSTPVRKSGKASSSDPPAGQPQGGGEAESRSVEDKPIRGMAVSTAQASEAEVRALVLAAIDRFNRHEVQPPGVAAFAPDADFVNVEGMWMKGAQEIHRGHSQASSGKLKNAKITLLDLSIRFPRPDVAVVHQLHEMSGSRDPGGTHLPPHRQLSTRVLVKEQGRWLTTAFQNTRVHPAIVAASTR